MTYVNTKTTRAVNTITAHPLSDRLRAADLTDFLPSGVTVSSVGEITQRAEDDRGDETADADVLTVGAGSANAAEFTYRLPDGSSRTVEVGAAVQFQVSGGTHGVMYLLTVPLTMSDGQEDAVVCPLKIEDGRTE